MDIKLFFSSHQGLIIYIAIVIVGAIVLTRLIRMGFDRYLNNSSRLLNSDPTNFRFLKNSVAAVIYLTALILILYSLPGGKTLAVSLFASAGIIAAIVGFASQAAFSNIVSGIFIVIFKPFRVHDIIEIGQDRRGTVEDITLRHTVIRDFENKRIIVPNTVISQETVINLSITDSKICRHIEFGISYGSEIQLARKIIREEAESHPLCLDNRSPEDLENGVPKVRVKVLGFGDSAVRLRAWVWSNDPLESFELLTDINESIKERFDKEGIEIPFPHRTVFLRKEKE